MWWLLRLWDHVLRHWFHPRITVVVLQAMTLGGGDQCIDWVLCKLAHCESSADSPCSRLRGVAANAWFGVNGKQVFIHVRIRNAPFVKTKVSIRGMSVSISTIEVTGLVYVSVSGHANLS